MNEISVCGNYQAVRIGIDQPTHYRLARKGESELVLQGWFAWQEPHSGRFGGEWRDIPIAEWGDTTPPGGEVEE